MNKSILSLCLILCLLAALPLAAQQRRTTTAAAARESVGAGTNAQPDVLVDVPNLSVEDIRLDVQNVHVQVALDARVANLLTLNAGAEAGIDRVRLQISGVRAEARLIVRLDKVAKIIDRTLQTIDNNPKIITNLLSAVDNTVNTVGGVANNALQPGGVVSQAVGTVGQTLNNVTAPGGLLTQTVNTLGQTVQRTVDATRREDRQLPRRESGAAAAVAGSRAIGGRATTGRPPSRPARFPVVRQLHTNVRWRRQRLR